MKKKKSVISDAMAMDFWGRVELGQQEAGFDTIKDLCREADVAYQTVINKRSKGKLPNTDTVLKLSRSIQKSVDWLFWGENLNTDSEQERVASLITNNKDAFEIAKYLLNMSEEDKKVAKVLIKKISTPKTKKRK